MESNFSFFKCIILLVSYLRTPPNPRLWRFSPRFSSESFIVLYWELWLTLSWFFKSKMWDLDQGWSIVFYWDAWLFQHCLLKSQFFLHWNGFAALSKINWLYVRVYFWTLYSIQFIFVSLPLPVALVSLE